MWGTLHADITTCHCCRRHKYAIKTLLCKIKQFCIVYRDMQLNNTQRAHCWLSIATIVTAARHSVTRCAHFQSCYLLSVRSACISEHLTFPQVKMKIRDVSSYKCCKIETPLLTVVRNMWHCFVSLACIMAVVPPPSSDPNSNLNVLLPWKQQQGILFWKLEAHLKAIDRPQTTRRAQCSCSPE